MERKSTSTTTITTDRIYEEFEPVTRLVPEPGFETIIVYLPGFAKEQLRVQVTSTRILRVTGERPGVGNKWIRFRKEFPLPLYVDADAISAKFEAGNVNIKLPKLVQQPSTENTKPSSTEHAKPQIQPPKATTDQTQTQTQTQTQIGSDQKPENEKKGPEKQVGTDQKFAPSKPTLEKPAEKEKTSDTNQERFRDSSQKAFEAKEHAEASQNNKDVLGGLMTELKRNRKVTISIAVTAALALAVGLYASKRFSSSVGESEG